MSLSLQTCNALYPCFHYISLSINLFLSSFCIYLLTYVILFQAKLVNSVAMQPTSDPGDCFFTWTNQKARYKMGQQQQPSRTITVVSQVSEMEEAWLAWGFQFCTSYTAKSRSILHFATINRCIVDHSNSFKHGRLLASMLQLC